MCRPCAGLALLGQIDEKFVEVVDVMEPLASGSQDRAFISRGYDATSHFETTVRPGAATRLPIAWHGCAASCVPPMLDACVGSGWLAALQSA